MMSILIRTFIKNFLPKLVPHGQQVWCSSAFIVIFHTFYILQGHFKTINHKLNVKKIYKNKIDMVYSFKKYINMLFWKNIDDPSNNISGRALRPIFDQTGSRPKFLHVLARFRNTFLIPQISPEIQIPAPNGKVQENRKFHNLKIEILIFFLLTETRKKRRRKKIQCHHQRTTTTWTMLIVCSLVSNAVYHHPVSLSFLSLFFFSFLIFFLLDTSDEGVSSVQHVSVYLTSTQHWHMWLLSINSILSNYYWCWYVNVSVISGVWSMTRQRK